mmetsp:Transcript_59440/g.181393  ORF Transcript_59440/g.181393 Transcript_59440/m.181393 type:complete len:250 (+) Transcript_59440:322-1071(+)
MHKHTRNAQRREFAEGLTSRQGRTIDNTTCGTSLPWYAEHAQMLPISLPSPELAQVPQRRGQPLESVHQGHGFLARERDMTVRARRRLLEEHLERRGQALRLQRAPQLAAVATDAFHHLREVLQPALHLRPELAAVGLRKQLLLSERPRAGVLKTHQLGEELLLPRPQALGERRIAQRHGRGHGGTGLHHRPEQHRESDVEILHAIGVFQHAVVRHSSVGAPLGASPSGLPAREAVGVGDVQRNTRVDT